jgi:hypothetical protein
MRILSFKIGDKRQVQGAGVRVGGRCGCGCTTRPFVTLSDGERGLTLRFETDQDLQTFKDAVKKLTWQSYATELELKLEGVKDE